MLCDFIDMQLLARVVSMYTHINLIGVAVFSYLPSYLQDIVRASTLLILIVIFTVWFSGDLPQIYGELVDSFVPSNNISSSIKMVVAGTMDVLLHVVPCFMVGLPQTASSFLFALLGLLGWYSLARSRIHEIYSPSVPADRGIMIASASAVAGAILLSDIEPSEDQPL